MIGNSRQTGKLGVVLPVVMLILAIWFWDDLMGVAGDQPELLSLEQFDCVFSMINSASANRSVSGHGGRFIIKFKNLTDEIIGDLYVTVTARHPPSRSNTHSLSTPTAPTTIKPGKRGYFKGAIFAPPLMVASGSVEELVCMMNIRQQRDGKLRGIKIRMNGFDLAPATEMLAPVTIAGLD